MAAGDYKLVTLKPGVVYTPAGTEILVSAVNGNVDVYKSDWPTGRDITIPVMSRPGSGLGPVEEANVNLPIDSTFRLKVGSSFSYVTLQETDAPIHIQELTIGTSETWTSTRAYLIKAISSWVTSSGSNNFLIPQIKKNDETTWVDVVGNIHTEPLFDLSIAIDENYSMRIRKGGQVTGGRILIHAVEI